MAERRMFSKKVIDTDYFMDMPASTQNLYFHLSMRADDDGFVASPKRISKLIGATEDDYKLLIAKKFIIPFDSGVCVITDWRINNYLRNDRYTETIYLTEKKELALDKQGKYCLGIPNGYQRDTQDRIELGKDSINNKEYSDVAKPITARISCVKPQKHKYGEYQHILLTNEELEKLNKEYGEEETQDAIKLLDEYVEMKGTPYKSHYLALRKWVYRALREQNGRKTKHGFQERQYSKEELKKFFNNLEDINIGGE